MSERSVLKDVFTQFVVPDVVRTAEYYRDVLGFEIIGFFLDPPVYAMARRNSVEFHFGKSDSGAVQTNQTLRKGLGADAYVVVSDINALYDELLGAGANVLQPPTERVYGSIEFEILDCDGHKIVFGD